MFATNTESVERFPKVFQTFAHGPAEEVGWFGWIYEGACSSKHNRRRRYVPDPERQFLRQLSAQWSTVRNLDLDSINSSGSKAVASVVEQWRPLFHMRSWIQTNREQFDNIQPNIVSAARTLRLLLDAPNYVNDRDRKTVQYVACRRQGTIYLTCSRAQDNQPETEDSSRLDKFERFLTRENGNGNPELEASKSTHFFSVLGRKFDDIKVLYTQKINCFSPMIGNPPTNYVQLMLAKSSQSVLWDAPYCHWSEQNPYRVSWAKTFINGCTQALVGHRNGSLLERCELMQTKDIPDKTSCSKPRCYFHWDKERNISFLKEFLELVQRTVVENYDSVVYGFETDHSRKDHVTIRTTEWSAGSRHFEENNILQTWGAENIWNTLGQQDPNYSPNAE